MTNQSPVTDSISSWVQFREVAQSRGGLYLKHLDRFQRSILVAGCQRSGTTMLARIISESEGIFKYFEGEDGELECALILSGLAQHEPQGRYCFQTTYLDDAYHEYFDHIGRYQLLWFLRNPYSTIYSLLYNWRREALYGTFGASILPSLSPFKKLHYYLFRKFDRHRVKLACLIYNRKMQQIPLIRSRLNDSEFAVIDYDDFVEHKDTVLPMIYRFIDVPYQASYADKVHSSSVKKKDRLSARETRMIRDLCEPNYREMLRHVSIGTLKG